MNKEELFKQFQEIILKTNGGNDDYIVAICQISNLVKEFVKTQEQQFAELKAENENLKEQYRLAKQEQNYWVDDYNKELKEKDQQIEKLQNLVKGWSDECERRFDLIKQIFEQFKLKAIHSNLGFMGKTKKGYYTIYVGDLEEIEKGINI